ncbi:MAG: hypothetical protein R3B70_14405 [Polyangiaceae bacterium]
MPAEPCETRRLSQACVLLALALAGCGARSDLLTGKPCKSDAQCDDGVPCTVDFCGPRGCDHTPQPSLCDDGVPCTVDECSPVDGCHSTASDALCDDDVKCTTDACDSTLGCQNTPHDDKCDDDIDCTVDACDVSAGCQHAPMDAVCDDGIFCTKDTCDPFQGCSSVYSNTICDDGISCTKDACDITIDACTNSPCDSDCDDGVFCNGVERCDGTFGCVAGPSACDLGLACSADACEEGAEQCTHQAPGNCIPPLRLLACDLDGTLYSVSPYGGPAMVVAPSAGFAHVDIAILDGTRWFALDPNLLVELVPKTNQALKVYSVPYATSLGVGPDGMLYSAHETVYRIHPDTGVATPIGMLPPGYESSGDIAFVGDRLIVSTDGPCGGALVEVDKDTGQSTILGGNGLDCAYGLASWQGALFVLNCDGKIGTFNLDTGVMQVLSTQAAFVCGAEVLP